MYLQLFSTQAYPRHLTPLPFRGGGNLIIRVFQGVRNLIPICRGWEIGTVASISFEISQGHFACGELSWRMQCGKDRALVANWLWGKGLNKLFAVFEGIILIILSLIFLILDSGFEYMNVLSCVYNEIQYLYRRFNTTIKSLTKVINFDLPHECMFINKVSDDACQ